MELYILDTYEADEYDNRTIDDTSEVLQAYAYVWGNSIDTDLYVDWNFEDFEESKLKDYVDMTKDFVKELQDTTSSLP
ncbi:hypothetical protein Tco_0769501 [Tanacetum coccineum]|uniref:Uncharacterized protein n=1 Tax=Tanacetum coccineum TaxID=301880 RepID=A0ABQ4Z9X2_9ASTR